MYAGTTLVVTIGMRSWFSCTGSNEQDNLMYMQHSWRYLIEELKKFEQVKEVRGRGLMIGIEFQKNWRTYVKNCYLHTTFYRRSQPNVIRLLPALI